MEYNTASGNYATIPGGANNVAGGQYSFAAGQQAQATNTGAFVWADSQNAAFTSTNNDSFNVRAQGGARFVTGGTGLTVDGQSVFTGNNGGTLTNLSAAQISSGTIPLAQLPGSLVTNNATGVTLNGAFSGNGSGLTILGATNSFTPTIGDGTINFTTGTARGYYSEAGNLAFVEIWLKWNSKNSAVATSQLQISLPFSVNGSPRALFTLGYVNGITFTNQIIATAIQGSSSLQLFDLVSGGAANNINVTNCSTSGEIQLSGFFRTQ